jgi:hypothetical protein
MNTQLLIQQLKQLPRVGQGGSQGGASQYGGNQPGGRGSGQISADDITNALADLGEVVAALVTTAGITTVEETFNKLSTQITNVTQQVDLFGEKLKLSVAASGQLATGFAKVAQNTKDFLLTTQEVNRGAIALEQQLPGVGRAMKGVTSEIDNAAVFTARMQTAFRLTEEEAAKLTVQGLAYTGNVKEFNRELVTTAAAIEESFNAQDALAVITKEISTTSALTRGYLGDQTDQLARAAFVANRYGISMDQAMIAGKKTLDIESSIAAEMELMALTGRDITDASGNNLLQKMREATATGDLVGLMEAQTELAENYSDIIQDPLLSNSLANLSGLQEEQLAQLNETNKARKAGINIGEEQGKGVAPENLPIKDLARSVSQMQISRKLTDEETLKYTEKRAAITTPEQIERTGQEFRTITEASGQATAAAIALNEQAQNLQGGIRSAEDIGIVTVLQQLTTTLQGSKPMTAQELTDATRSGIDGATITVVMSDTGTGTGTISTLNSTGATATGP